MNTLIIGIETLPNQSLKAELKPKFDENNVKVGNTKDPMKIQEKIMQAEQAFEEGLTKKMSVESNYCQILSIGYIEIDENGEEISRDVLFNEKGDKSILIAFSKIYKGKTLVGWNSKNFDIPIIWKRSILTGGNGIFSDYQKLCTPYYDNGSIDLMGKWNGAGKYGKLIDCAALLGIPAKTGLDGSMIYDAFKAKQFDEIKAYNIQDCEVTLEIYKRIVL